MLIETLMQMTGEDRSSVGTASLHTSSFSVNPLNVLMQKMDGIAVSLQLYAVIVESTFQRNNNISFQDAMLLLTLNSCTTYFHLQ